MSIEFGVTDLLLTPVDADLTVGDVLEFDATSVGITPVDLDLYEQGILQAGTTNATISPVSASLGNQGTSTAWVTTPIGITPVPLDMRQALVASFPALVPSTRQFKPAKHPLTLFRAQDAATVRRLWANAAGQATMDLGFRVLTDAETESVFDAWDAARGNYGALTLPAEIYEGITGDLLAKYNLTGTGLTWCFDGPPVARSVAENKSDVEVKLKARRLGATRYSGLVVSDEVESLDELVDPGVYGDCDVGGDTPDPAPIDPDVPGWPAPHIWMGRKTAGGISSTAFHGNAVVDGSGAYCYHACRLRTQSSPYIGYALIVKRDLATGAIEWQYRLSNSVLADWIRIAMHPSGDVVVAYQAGQDIYEVARITAAGSLVWARRQGAFSDGGEVRHVACNADSVYVCGHRGNRAWVASYAASNGTLSRSVRFDNGSGGVEYTAWRIWLTDSAVRIAGRDDNPTWDVAFYAELNLSLTSVLRYYEYSYAASHIIAGRTWGLDEQGRPNFHDTTGSRWIRLSADGSSVVFAKNCSIATTMHMLFDAAGNCIIVSEGNSSTADISQPPRLSGPGTGSTAHTLYRFDSLQAPLDRFAVSPGPGIASGNFLWTIPCISPDGKQVILTLCVDGGGIDDSMFVYGLTLEGIYAGVLNNLGSYFEVARLTTSLPSISDTTAPTVTSRSYGLIENTPSTGTAPTLVDASGTVTWDYVSTDTFTP